MNEIRRWIVGTALFVSFAGAGTRCVFAGDDEVGAVGKTDGPPAAEAAAKTAEKSSAAPSLERILERLDKVERELIELRIKSRKVPADKGDQRVLTLLETPYLGSAYVGSPTNQRFVALKLMLVNLTDQPLTLKRDDVQLSVDGQNFPIKEPSRQMQFPGFQIGQQQVQVRSLQTPKEVNVPVGGSSSTWMLFPELPAGSHVPQLVLKLKIGDKTRDIDVNAAQRDVLGVSVERIGPRQSLGLVTVAGALNTINVGSLVDEIDSLSADKLVRVVIRFKETSSVADSQLASWLNNAATSLGRQQINETQFPALPASLRELHIAAFPNVNSGGGMEQSYPMFQSPNPGAVGARIHKTEAEAVVAALRSAYEAVPRDELEQAIQSGSKLERAAAMAGGGSRLPVERLPLLLGFADDNDPVIQQAALAALSHFGEKPAIDKLIEVSRKNVPGLSATAIAGLAGSRYAAAHQALLELLQNEPPEGKKSIVRILALYPRPVWSDAIYEFVKDSRSGLNVEALQALVQVGHPRLVEVLQDALRTSDRNLSQAAFNVLASRTDRESEEIALAYTLEQLKSTPASPAMLQLLDRVKDARALPLLMAQFGKHENKTRLIGTLTLLGDSETARFLAEKYVQLQNHEKGEVLKALARLDKQKFLQLSAQALLMSDGSIINNAVQGLQEDGGPEAIKVMIDALDAAPNSFTWSYLCNALAQAGTGPARAALIKARDSENIEKRNYAISALQSLRHRSPGYQYVMQAQGFSSEQKWKEAIEQFDLAIQLDPSLSDAYAERGHALLHLEKPGEAAKDFAKALELDPFSSLAVTGSCLALVLADGKHVEAIKQLEDARAKFPRDAMFHYNAACVYGRAYERVGKDTQAADREKLLEQYKQATLADLKASMQFGFTEVEYMKKDPDLAPFKDMPEFQQLIATPPQPARGGRNRRFRP